MFDCFPKQILSPEPIEVGADLGSRVSRGWEEADRHPGRREPGHAGENGESAKQRGPRESQPGAALCVWGVGGARLGPLPPGVWGLGSWGPGQLLHGSGPQSLAGDQPPPPAASSQGGRVPWEKLRLVRPATHTPVGPPPGFGCKVNLLRMTLGSEQMARKSLPESIPPD